MVDAVVHLFVTNRLAVDTQVVVELYGLNTAFAGCAVTLGLDEGHAAAPVN
jgi:hypothetical protein